MTDLGLIAAAILLTSLAVQASGGAGDGGIIAPGASLQKLAGDFSFTEGPACDAHGNIFFTDQPNDRIMEWSTGGKLSTFMQPCGRSNGLCFDANGDLLACADNKNELWRIHPDGTVTHVLQKFGGKLLNGPNDVWIRPDGGLYFTDPFFKRDYWDRGPKEQDATGVYYLAAGSAEPARVIADLDQPNGIIGTPDGKTLYVAQSTREGHTYAYNIEPDGTLTHRRHFCDLYSDGMTIDNEGSVYLTGLGVTVFNRQGKQIQHIDVPEKWTGNICFGGADRKLLFVTASTSVYGLRMRVHGVGSQ